MMMRAELRAIADAYRETFRLLRAENEALRRRGRAARDRLARGGAAGLPLADKPDRSTREPWPSPE
jgi:hypothetical protein